VFWNDKCDGGAIITAEDVQEALINHDHYDPRILVKEAD